MSFYTNVSVLGNNILFRGISNEGKRFKDRVEYHPTLFIPTKEETKFRTLEGKTCESQVCIVTKRNALRYWGDMYTEAFEEMAKQYPDVATHHELVDAACMKFVQAPWAFDVVAVSYTHLTLPTKA